MQIYNNNDDPKSGEYTMQWNTTGLEVCKKGKRNNIAFILRVSPFMAVFLQDVIFSVFAERCHIKQCGKHKTRNKSEFRVQALT